MSWSGQNLLQILMESLGLPVGFLGVFLTMLLALTLAPFLGGLKVGPIEVPKLPTRGRRGLMVGTLLAWVVLLLPVLPTETAEPPCLRTLEIDHLTDVGEELGPTTLRQQLQFFEFLMAAHELPIHVTYDELVESRALQEHGFLLVRTTDVAKSGCWVLSEIERAMNQSVSSEEERITIFASCKEVFVALQGSDPTEGILEGEFKKCS